MKNFEFFNPTKILFGRGKIALAGKEIAGRNLKKVLLLYGKGSIFKNGVYNSVIQSLKDNSVEWVEFGGIKPNPTLSQVEEAIRLSREENIDAVLAVGGGSVIDSAKAITAGIPYRGSIWDAFEGKVQLSASLPLFTVLTLSATGSEMNPWAVVTKEDEKKKWAFSAGDSSYPLISILDPEVQFSLPKEQTVYGAIDALSHIFELYFDGTDGVDLIDEVSEGLIRSVMRNVKILLENPSDYEARAGLVWAATLALNGINGAGRSGGDWASHNLEHPLSAYYDIAHGAGLAIVFPAWMTFVHDKAVGKFARFAEKIFNITEGSEEEKGLKAISKLKDFYRELGAPVSLEEINVNAEEIDSLAETAAMLPMGRLKKIGKEEALNIYKMAL